MIVRLAMRPTGMTLVEGEFTLAHNRCHSPMSVSTDPTVAHREDLPWPDEPPDTTPCPFRPSPS